MSDMATFRTTIKIASHARPDETRELPDALVDTGSELTWVPAEILEALGVVPVKTSCFRLADGRTLERHIGYAIIHAGGTQTTDEVAFAERSDMTLLGARAMEGLNLRVEPRLERLVDAGPIDAAAVEPAAGHHKAVPVSTRSYRQI
jgi:predicted aspartyl protease